MYYIRGFLGLGAGVVGAVEFLITRVFFVAAGAFITQVSVAAAGSLVVLLFFPGYAVAGVTLAIVAHGGFPHRAGDKQDECSGKISNNVGSDISATLVEMGNALVLAVRGTEPHKISNWAVDLNTEPPPPGETWPYGVYHLGFRVAPGLGSDLAGDRSCEMRYVHLGAHGDYERVPGPELEDLVTKSPFELMEARTEQALRAKPDLNLYVTGHSLGAALANIFSAAVVIPSEGPGGYSRAEWDKRSGALYNFGQPRLGYCSYTARLESTLSRDRMDRRFTCVVDTDDIVCRVPPPQVTPLPWYTDAPFWQHPSYTVLLPAVHAAYDRRVQAPRSPAEESHGHKPSCPEEDPSRVPPRGDDADNDPSVVHLCEQPAIYRGSSFWHAVKKASWATWDCFRGKAGNSTNRSTLTWSPAPSGLRVATLWLLIFILLPLSLALLPTPFFPLGILLVVVSLLEGGLPQGDSDHAMDGFLKALVASSESDWDLQ